MQIGDASVAFLELRTGGVDLVSDVPTNLLGQYKALKNAEQRLLEGYGIYYMPKHVTQAPFDDIAVRKATRWRGTVRPPSATCSRAGHPGA
ncbi:extracellular solute-binding protein, family 5 Middle [Thalassovita taeanensis]|uniref:Extracellular solute-binding protein, family 5 Middle n=1 Tax=Thalassovita taeanensis TaxID=657014 RepID=A0A1H9BYL5_9RHOB|nr:extracellular solute-binding protein, family 5 Middle [Thalassovita taeanensis]